MNVKHVGPGCLQQVLNRSSPFSAMNRDSPSEIGIAHSHVTFLLESSSVVFTPATATER